MVLQEWPSKSGMCILPFTTDTETKDFSQGEFELDEDDELQANTQTGAKAKKAVDQQKQPPAKCICCSNFLRLRAQLIT